MNKTIKIKRGLKSDLTLAGVVVGEPKFTTDTKELFIGDGTNNILINKDVYTKTEVDALKADKIVLTNLVSNGDLLITKPSPNQNEPLGFRYWDATDISLTNGIAKFTATKQFGRLSHAITTTNINDILYGFARYKADNNLVRLELAGKSVNHSGNNNFEYVSMIRPATQTMGILVSDTRTSGWTPVEVDYIGVINLTAIFGAGNEPTKEQMDAIIKLKGYFDTTTIDLKDLMLLGFTQEARMTPTLTNATTTYLTYRKDDLGYVDIVGDLTITTFGTNFTLPEGYRPLTQLRLPILTSTNTLGYIIINTNGTVVSNANATIYINARFATI